MYAAWLTQSVGNTSVLKDLVRQRLTDILHRIRIQKLMTEYEQEVPRVYTYFRLQSYLHFVSIEKKSFCFTTYKFHLIG